MITEKTNVRRSGLSSLAKGLARVLPGSGPKKQSGSNGAFLAVFSAFATLSLLFTPNATLAQDDTPEALTVSFAESSYTAIENGARAMVMINLDKPADRSVSIPINTAPNTGPFSLAFSNVDFDVGEMSRTIAVTATDDKDLISQTVRLSLGTLPSGVSLGSPSSATVTLWDDDLKDLNVSFGAGVFVARENGGNATVPIVLNSPSDRDLRIPITATLGADTVAEDYKLSATEVVFNAGQSRKTITVSAEDDDDLTAGSVTLGFGPLPFGVTTTAEGRTTADVSLSDDGRRIVEFAMDKGTAEEGGTATTVTVNLMPAPAADAVVRISVSPAPARTNPDFTLTGLDNNTLTVAADSSSADFTITANEDDDRVSEMITFRIVGPLPATSRLGAKSSTVITLQDNEAPPAPNISFDRSAYSAREPNYTTVAVIMNPVSTKEVKVPVTVKVTGTEPAAGDVKLSTEELVFAPGQARRTFTVTAVADADITNETATLTLGTPTGGDTANPPVLMGGTQTATVTLIDDVKRVVDFGAATYSVTEGGSTVDVEVVVAPAPASGTTMTIPISVSPSSGDFTLPATFANRRVAVDSSGTAAITVTSKTNDGNTTDQKVTFRLGGLPSGARAGKPNSAVLTVRDADRPTVSFGAAAYTAIENGAAATVEITLSPSSPDAVTVPITTTAASGTEDEDFLLSATEVVFAPGEQRKTITVVAAADADSDAEAVTLGFGTLTPASAMAETGGQTSTAVTLADDGQRVVSIAATPASVGEGNPSTVTVTMAPAPSAEVKIPITVMPATGDFFTLPDGFKNEVTVGTDGTGAFDVTNKADDNSENDKVTFGFGSLPVSVRAGSPSTVTVTMTEPGLSGDDQPTVSFGAAAYTATENGAAATVEITMSPMSDKKVEVAITMTGGDPLPATLSAQKVAFEPGEGRKTVTVTAKPDTNTANESVTLTLGTPTPANSAVLGEQSTISVTLVDDGLAKETVAFSEATVTADEGTAATVDVTLSTAPGTDEKLTIPITMMPDMGDFILSPPRRVTFGAGETTRTITVTTTADMNVETEDVTVTLGLGALPSDHIPGTIPTAKITFEDDDRAELTVEFAKATETVAEGKDVKVRVSLSAKSDRTVTIPIKIGNAGAGTTAEKDDYSLDTMELVFNKGDQHKDITFTAAANTDAETDDAVALVFGDLPGDVTAGTTAAIVVSITDSHAPLTVDFAGPRYAAIEGGVSATIMVNVNPASDRALMIPIDTDPKTGPFMLEGVTGENGKYMLAIPNKGTSATITVTATDDGNTLSDMVTLKFGTLPGGVTTTTAGTTDRAVVTLVDNMEMMSTVSFGAAEYTAMEGGDAAMVMVKLDPPLPSGSRQTLTIPVSGWPMDGAAPADFMLSATGVTFSAGEMYKTITVTAVDNEVPKSADGTVKLIFGAMPGAALPEGVSAGDPAETTVTLEDDDRNEAIVAYFMPGTATAMEGGDAAMVSVGLDLGEGNEMLDREITLPITVTSDADEGDYTVDTMMVTFPAGASAGAEVWAPITVTANLDDDNVSETVTLGLGSLPLGVTAGGADKPATAVVTLEDDMLMALTVSFGAAEYSAMEGDSATVTVSLNAAADREVTVPITTDPAEGSFELSASEVVFAEGVMSQDITVMASYDDDTEDNMVTLGFGDLTGHVVAGDQATATVTLVDDGLVPLEVNFAAATYTANEGGDAVTVTVRLNRRAEREITVPITMDPADGPYELSVSELTFGVGQQGQNITVTATLDDNTEDAMVTLGFDLSGLERVNPGEQATAVVMLADDGLVPVTVSFDAAEYTAMEGGAHATVMVNLSADPRRDITIAVNSDPGMGDNFEVSATEVMFSAGVMSQEITVMAHLDDDTEDQMVTLSLGTLPDRVSAGANTSAMVTLADDGLVPVMVSFAASEYTATEGGAAATVMVNLSADPMRDVTVPITTDPADGDFDLSASEVMFSAGVMSQEITVTATSDDDVDDEMVTLGLGDLPERVTAGDPASAAVSLIDKGYTVTFDVARQTVRESERGTVTASISPAANGSVSVPLSVTHQGGASANDYSGVPGSLSFSGGQSSTSFTVSVMADEENDPGESIDVSLGSLPDKVNAGDLTMTTVEFEQFRTPEQFSRTLQAALAVVAGAMGDSAVNAIEGRFERYRESMGSMGDMGSRDSERTYGHWNDMESPGMAMTGHQGYTGMDNGFVPMATTTPGTGLTTGSTGYGRSHTSGSMEETISLGALATTARPGESVIASGYGMAPNGEQDGNFSGVAFEMAMEHGDEGTFSPVVWVQGDLQRFDGEIEDIGMDFDGGLDAIHLGVDLYANGQTLAGVSLMQSWGNLDYTDDGLDGSLDSSMSTFHPYVYFQANQNLGVWGILGFGSGSVDVSEPDRTHEFDADFSMFAGGVRSVLNRRDNNELGLSADAFMAELSTDAADDISGVSGEAQRARVMVDWLSNSTMEAGQDFSWKAEIGGRFDGGDGIEGVGIEAGFRAGLVDSDQGLDVALGARALLLHENDASDYGIGVQVTWDPGEKRKGMVASLGSSYGQDRGGSTSLWDNGNAMNPIGTMWQETQVRVDGEIGYAGILTPFSLPGTVMPYSRARFSGYGQEFGVGTRWTPAETSSRDTLIPATFELEGLTRETRTGLSDLALVLRMSIPFGGEKAIEPRNTRNRAVNEAAMGPTVSTAYPETETTGAE